MKRKKRKIIYKAIAEMRKKQGKEVMAKLLPEEIFTERFVTSS